MYCRCSPTLAEVGERHGRLPVVARRGCRDGGRGGQGVGFPYVKGTAQAINYLSGSRVTLKEDLFEQKRAESNAPSSSSAAPPEPTRVTVNLPEGVKAYGSFRRRELRRSGSIDFCWRRAKQDQGPFCRLP